MDRGKPGSKIHAVSDRNGLPLTVLVTAANVNDNTALEDVLDRLHAIRQPLGRPRRWPAKLHGDKGYDYRSCREVVRRRGMIARISRKGIESATHLGRHRYVIERCLEWVTRFRRLARRYDRKTSHFLGFLRLASAIICFRRATRLNLLTSTTPNDTRS